MAAEPISGAAAGIIGWKALGFGALVGTGVVGALMMAVFDPPKDKKTMLKQALVAAVSSLFFGPAAVRTFDHFFDFINLATASGLEVLEWGAPIYFLIGAFSWGAFGAAVRLREIIRDRGAQKLAAKVGLDV
jgi:hypothetical protein